MGVQGRAFAFQSPEAAVEEMFARLALPSAPRPRGTISLDDAAGRILAETVRADRDSPAFDYAAMDGYAVSAVALQARVRRGGPVMLPVVAESRIGSAPPAFPSDSPAPVAVRIATGAPIPPGADAVIRREEVSEDELGSTGSMGSITIAAPIAAGVKPGDHIRRRGENAREGDALLSPGDLVSPAALGTLASVGAAHPTVFERLRIALIITGEELVEPGEALAAYQVRNSNGPSVRAILASPAWAGVVRASHAHDASNLDAVLAQACEEADAVVLTGGVSMGHRDPVRAAVERRKAEIVFHGLPQRPGKPMLGAVLRHGADSAGRNIPIFGLPGNPVSAMVTCTRIVLPVLARCAGARRASPTLIPRSVRLANPDGRTLDLWWHRLARLVVDPGGASQAELIESRGSGDAIAAGASDGFVEAPPGGPHGVLPFYAWPTGI